MYLSFIQRTIIKLPILSIATCACLAPLHVHHRKFNYRSASTTTTMSMPVDSAHHHTTHAASSSSSSTLPFNTTFQDAVERLTEYQHYIDHQQREAQSNEDDHDDTASHQFQPPDASKPAVAADRREEIHTHRKKRRQKSPSPDRSRGSTYAAVLIGIFEHPVTREIYVMLTQRASHMKSHSGEVALPGGKRDDEDNNDNVKTALREANEEIGLPSAQCQHRATMPWSWSKAGHKVYPIVCTTPVPIVPSSSNSPQQSNASTFTPILNADEVEYFFIMPLHVFLQSDVHDSQPMLWRNQNFVLHRFNYTTSEYIYATRISSSDSSYYQNQQIDGISTSMNADNNTLTTTEQPPPRTFNVWGLTAYFCIEVAQIVYKHDTEFETTPSSTLRAFRQRADRETSKLSFPKPLSTAATSSSNTDEENKQDADASSKSPINSPL